MTSADGPDIFRWTLVGGIDVSEMQRLFSEQRAFCHGKSGIYLIVDMARLGSVSPEARRIAARGTTADEKPMPVQGIAVVGGSFQMRMLGKMVNTAASLLHRMNPTPIDFFDTVQQARDWIETLKRANERKEMVGRVNSGPPAL